MLEQQDTSEAFAFITETLQLPLLSLQVDLFHQGKKDKDDHKVVYERLLNLAVPPDPEGKGIKLEDCMEEYFNAQVDVKRDSEEGKKSPMRELSHGEVPKLVHRDTIRLITEELGEASTPTVTASPITLSPLLRTPTNEKEPMLPAEPNHEPETIPSEETKPTGESKPTEESKPKEGTKPEEDGQTPTVELAEHSEASSADQANLQKKLSVRTRSTSVIQRVLLDEQGRPSSPDNPTMLQKAVRKGSTVVKAVTIPAWQFFRLIRAFLLITRRDNC